jgi:hypothetical protein
LVEFLKLFERKVFICPQRIIISKAMNIIELRVDEKQNYTYCVHLLGTDARSEFELRFDLAEKQELKYIMQGISHGDAGAKFEIDKK